MCGDLSKPQGSAVMVKTCVAAGCSNTYKEGVSLFHFPKDSVMRKKWADQVKKIRDKWEPTDHSVLCSKHFEESCFETDTLLMGSLGLGKKKIYLKADAVPTLFSKPISALKRTTPSEASPVPEQKRRKSAAYEKRERARVSFELVNVAKVIESHTKFRLWKS